MSDLSTRPSEQPSAWILRRIQEAYLALGLPQKEILARLPAEEDITAIRTVLAQRPPLNILEVGSGDGALHLALALAFPDAALTLIDHDLSPPRETPDLSLADLDRTPAPTSPSLTPVAAAARRLGVDPRLTIVSGAFASAEGASATSAQTSAKPRIVGPDICASSGPFDLIVVGATRVADVRAADLRLAASALSDHGIIATLGALGADGSAARAAVFDLLRYNRDFFYLHPPIQDGRGKAGLLRHRSAGWFPGFPPPSPSSNSGDSQEVKDAMARLVAATFGERPILEIAAGSPVLGASFRALGGATRTLRLATADWDARFFDPLLDQIVTALDQTPGAGLFSADLCDFASDEFLARLLSRLSERGGCMMVCITPPGEAGVAGLASRPAARIVDIAASQGLRTYSTAGLETEPALAQAIGDRTRYASRLLLAPAPEWRDGAGRPLEELTPISASRREQIELQRLHAGASLGARLRVESQARSEADALNDALRARLEAIREAALQESARKDAALETLRSEVGRLSNLNLALSAAQALAEQALLDERSAFESALRDERSQMEDMTRRHAEALRSLSETSEVERLRLETSLVSLRQEIERSRQDLESVRALRDADQARYAYDLQLERQKSLEALATIDDLKRTVTARDQELTTAGSQVASVLQSLDAERTEISRLKGVLADQDVTIRTLTAQQAEQASKHEELLRKSSETDSLIDGLAQQEALAHEKITSLLTQIELSAREEATLRQEIETLKSRIEDSEGSDRAVMSDLQASLGALTTERDLLRERVESANLELIAASCREEDSRVSLERVSGHLIIMRDALDRWSRDPDAFNPGALAFPVQEASNAPGDDVQGLALPDQLQRLHAAAGDLSMDLVDRLKVMSNKLEAVRSETRALLAAGEASHEAGLRRAEQEFADRLGLVEAEVAEVAEVVGSNSDVIARIAALVSKRPEAGPAAGMAVTPPSQPDATIRQRLLDQGASLEILRKALEAQEKTPLQDARTPSRNEQAQQPLRPARDVASSLERSEEPKKNDRRRLRPADRALTRRALSGPREMLRAYLETVRLLDAQRRLRRALAHRGLNPLVFDATRYEARYDISPYTDPLRHYLLIGERQGCSPVEGFDPFYYAAHMTEAGDWKGSLLLHFLEEGARKGLSPSATLHPISALARESGVSPLEYFFLAQRAALSQGAPADRNSRPQTQPGSAVEGPPITPDDNHSPQ